MEISQPIVTITIALVSLLAGAGVSWGSLMWRLKTAENSIIANKLDRQNEINEIKLEQDKAIHDLKERDIKELRDRHDREIETIKKEVLWKGECDRCQDKWSSVVNSLKETMQNYSAETNRRLGEIMERLEKIK